METTDFAKLGSRQAHALVVSVFVRNRLEGFHVAHLSDAQMKELNQLTRYAIYDAIELIETMSEDPKKQMFFDHLVRAIPEYWEIPGRDPDPTKMQ